MNLNHDLEAYFESGSQCEFKKPIDNIVTGDREESMDADGIRIETTDNGNWRCPHPTDESYEYCVFHRRDGAGQGTALTDVFLEVLSLPPGNATRRQRRRRKQFIGMDIDELILEDDRLPSVDQFAVDLRSVDAELVNCDNAKFETPLDLRGSSIETFTARFASLPKLYAQKATFQTIKLDQIELGKGYFDQATAGLARFYLAQIEYANFHGTAFERANFLFGNFGEMGFFDCVIDLATFHDASFEGAYFNDASIEYLNLESTDGHSLALSGLTASFVSLRISTWRKVRFHDAEVNRLRAPGVKWEMTAADDADLGVVSFQDGEIGEVDFDQLSFTRSFVFERMTVADSMTIKPKTVAPNDFGYLSLRESRLPRGTLAQPETGSILYDFEQTTLGNVNIDAEGNESLNEYLRFLKTDFDGFDFGAHENLKLSSNNYQLHQLYSGAYGDIKRYQSVLDAARTLHPAEESSPLAANGKYNEVHFDAIDRDVLAANLAENAWKQVTETNYGDSESRQDYRPDLNPTTLEQTYLKAKIGAAQVGDVHAGGRFFEKEYIYRRRSHWQAAVGAPDGEQVRTRLRRGSEWLRSGLLAATTGYGERPWRVVGASIGIVALFALLYQLTGVAFDQTVSTTLTEDFVFSIQSFVTLIVGPPPRNTVLVVRAASAIEAFLGAFFVALFVFTLTRKLHR
jgi:uncharacterized protein YjbI with pentapeptide repeats